MLSICLHITLVSVSRSHPAGTMETPPFFSLRLWLVSPKSQGADIPPRSQVAGSIWPNCHLLTSAPPRMFSISSRPLPLVHAGSAVTSFVPLHVPRRPGGCVTSTALRVTEASCSFCFMLDEHDKGPGLTHCTDRIINLGPWTRSGNDGCPF